MLLKKLKIKNFKSFRDISIGLNNFNVLIGPNGAGKSNLLSVFRFVRDIVYHGLENAISMQGGSDYVRNINLRKKNDDLSLCIEIEPLKAYGVSRDTEAGPINLRLKKFNYSFSLNFPAKDKEYAIKKDRMEAVFDFHRSDNIETLPNEENYICTGSLEIKNDSGKPSIDFRPDGEFPVSHNSLFPLIKDMLKFLQEKQSRVLILESPIFYMFPFEKVARYIHDITIYDFEPKYPKYMASVAAKADLEKNGENLAIVIRRILEDEERKRMFFNFVSDVLPFIDSIRVEKHMDRYLQLVIKEKYQSQKDLPASLMSEGTIFIIALIVALYFEKKPFAIFEEPERRIHPHLISKIIDMMKDACTRKQIITSTHNPEIVKFAGLENILFVTRDAEGFSTIIRLHEKAEIQAFLKNEIGIEELYVQNLLGM